MCVATMHDAGYNYLYPLTWDANGLLYAQTWGYETAVLTDGKGMQPGFAKIKFLIELCEARPDLEWILWKDCDGLITNFAIKIEDIIDNECHMMISTFWGGICAGMFIVRNSLEGVAYMRMLMSYLDTLPHEQDAMEHTLKEYIANGIVKLVPQHILNASCCLDGAHPERGMYDPRNHVDILGEHGEWSPGDWIMHWPGQHPQLRLFLAKKYLQKVVPAITRNH